MNAQERKLIAAAVLSLIPVLVPRLEQHRQDKLMKIHRLARQQGVIEGANAMFQELSSLKGKAHEQAYQAFWHVYDRRESL